MNTTANQLLLIVLAGAFTGTALMPMKFTRGWRFENTWLLYSLCAYVIFPVIVATVTVPHLLMVYAHVGVWTCLSTALLGVGWGVAIVLNGIAVTLVGLSLASALLMGSSIALGSLVALVGRFAQVSHDQLVAIVVLDLVMLIGVGLCAVAGNLRDARLHYASQGRRATGWGIVLCLVAGALSTFFNAALAHGEPIAEEAVRLGAFPSTASNAIWAIAVSAGALPSLVWCIAVLWRNSLCRHFRTRTVQNMGLCLVMAVLWISGAVVYGRAASSLGEIGAAIGWPVYMSGVILIGSFWGLLTQEWRGASRRSATWMLAGIAVQIAAIVTLGCIHG